MMNREGKYSVIDVKGTKARALKLPYKGDRFYMVVILPNEKHGLDELEKGLDKIQFSKDFEFDKPSTYNIGLPKFKIEANFELIKTL